MTDDWNDRTVPRQPAPPQYQTHPAGSPPVTASAPPEDATPPGVARHARPDESAWVRSVYLFGACATGGVLMIIGVVVALSSLVAIASPDSGLRDGWDRGLVGATEVVDDGLDVFDEFSRMQLEDDFERFCDGRTDDSFCEDLADRIDDEVSTIPDELSDNIGLIRDEVHRQIRVGAIARLVGGLALAVIGLFLFRFHSRQVTVYAKA